MEKKIYAQIDFLNCQLDYDYTICKWDKVSHEIQVAEMSFMDFDPDNLEEDLTPSFEVKPVIMTEKEFENWQLSNIE